MPKRLPYEILILASLTLDSCDRPAWEDKLDVADVNARNAIYRVNEIEAPNGQAEGASKENLGGGTNASDGSDQPYPTHAGSTS